MASATTHEPIILLLVGLPGSGKTSISKVVNRVLRGPMLSSERIRRALFDLTPQEEEDQDFTEEELAITYRGIKFGLRLLLADQATMCIVDGVFRSVEQRKMVFDTADEFGAEVVPFHISCSNDTAISRLKKRQETSQPAPAGPKTYKKLKEVFERPNPSDFVEIDTTDEPVFDSANRVLSTLLESSQLNNSGMS